MLRRQSVDDFLRLLDLAHGVIVYVRQDALGRILTVCNAQPGVAWTIDTTTYASHGDITTTSTTITDVTNMQNWVGREGGPVIGPGIPTGTTLLAVDEVAGELEISNAATATTAGILLARSLVYHVFAGENVLQALIKVAELIGMSWYLGNGREVVWRYNVTPASGVRAVTHADPVAAVSNSEICLIEKLTYIQDSGDLISHVHPWGRAEGGGRLGLSSLLDPGSPGTTGANDPLRTTRVAPDGYTLDLDTNTLSRDDAETRYGYSVQHADFNDIGPGLETSDPDYDVALVAARNQLFDLTIEHLRSQSYPQETFQVEVSKLDREVLPGETIRVIYRGFAGRLDEATGRTINYRWINVNRDMGVLEPTIVMDANGVRTPKLIVASQDRWPANDRELLIATLRQVQQAQARAR